MDDPEIELAAHSHDAFAKDMLSNPVMARAFFQEHLPAEVAAHMEWDSLHLEPGSFVKQSLQQAHSDLLFSVRASGLPCLLYILLEHQTTVDELMPLRLLGYILEILRAHEATHGLPLPPVLPMVLHQGPDRWTVSPNFEDLFELPPALAAILPPWLPKFSHVLLDLSQFDPREAVSDAHLTTVLLLMKLARQKRLMEFFVWLRDQAMLPPELLRQSLLYALHAEPVLDVEEIARTLEDNPKLKEQVMSTATVLIAKGKAEGKAEGKANGLLMGKLIMMQQMMRRPVSTEKELDSLGLEELEQRFNELQREYETTFKRP